VFNNSKRAQIEGVWYFLLDLTILMIILLTLFNFVDKSAESTTFEKYYLSRDISLLTSTLHASTGCTSLKYPQNTFWFTFSFENGQVKVQDTSGNLGGIGSPIFSYPYFTDSSIKLSNIKLTPLKAPPSEATLSKISPTSLLFTKSPPKVPGTFVDIYMCKNDNEITITDQENLCCPELKNLV
jgi:hypothetical protein